ncbi:hypothetical protein PL11201_530172 [Planktothrix sp. PCC 11201]|nr:hypothetical protein PL11201_530172 [Planktothrix sp. PCC 11201]
MSLNLLLYMGFSRARTFSCHYYGNNGSAAGRTHVSLQIGGNSPKNSSRS